MLNSIIFVASGLFMFSALIDACPRVCRCDTRRKIVFCNERELMYIPFGIPFNTETLLLQGNEIVNSHASETNLKGLKQLRKLDLSSNKLTAFPKHMPSSLRYISLQNNHLKYVGKTALRGLSNLEELNLNDNNISNAGIATTAFLHAKKLHVLEMSRNSLTQLPIHLPRNLKVLQVDNNKITHITTKATSSLQSLVRLDISANKIDTDIEEKSLTELGNLKSLDASKNRLKKVPQNLPENITSLLISKNRIKYIYRHDFDGLNSLKELDLSSNLLESVEKDSFKNVNVNGMELHDNPWRCDCYLGYLKSWMSNTSTVVSSESKVQCSTPVVFSDVTIRSIDDETLENQCAGTELTGRYLRVAGVKAREIEIEFKGRRPQDPGYLKFNFLFGRRSCDNCSLVATANARRFFVEPMTSEVRFPTSTIAGLESDTDYVICVFTSYQNADDVTTKSCIDVRTNPPPKTMNAANGRSGYFPLPTWALVVMGVLLLATVVVAILLGVMRNKKTTPSKYSMQPGLNFSIENLNQHEQVVDIQRIPQRYQLPSKVAASTTTLDALPEFDVTLMVRPHTSRVSVDGDDVSTTYTGVTEAGSYRKEHSYLSHSLKNSNNRTNVSNDFRHSWFGVTERVDPNDTGVYV